MRHIIKLPKLLLRPFLRRAVMLAAMAMLCLTATAQQFRVHLFRQLPNDISAYISPVRDLNGEACALLKVVADEDFAFSTPLGIVKRRNDIGEIWLYLPRGTRMITLKHPQWGVLRDYRFTKPLESRMTYELVITPTAEAERPPRKMPPIDSVPPMKFSQPFHPTPPKAQPWPRPRRPREPLQILALAQAGIGQGGNPTLGLRIGLMRRHGAYLQLMADLHTMPTTTADCNRQGTLTDGTGATPYYTGNTAEARRTILAGAMHRIAGEFCLYEGLGYGERRVAWQMAEGGLTRNTAYSAKGLCAELGGIYRFYQRLALSAGVQTIAFKHWEGIIGIGVHF